MDQSRIINILKLMKLLTANVDYTIDDISERLEISRRTTYRYIESFKEAGFMIEKTNDCFRLSTESPYFKDISQLVHFTKEEAHMLSKSIEAIDDTNVLKQNLKKKLASVYNFKMVADTVVSKKNAESVHVVIDGIEQKKQMLFKDYSSGHGDSVKDRLVEPYEFTANYVQIWCYDVEAKWNKMFKTARIGKAVVLANSWNFEERHQRESMDVFRMSGHDLHHVVLELDVLSHSLLIEEYPLSEDYIKQESSIKWLFESDVCGLEGVGRFVIGLAKNVKVIDSKELKCYIRNYIEKYFCN